MSRQAKGEWFTLGKKGNQDQLCDESKVEIIFDLLNSWKSQRFRETNTSFVL